MSLAPKFLVATSVAISLSLPSAGNLAEAFKAIIDNPESLTCTLDTELADEFHDSCQQKKNIVRFRAGRILTIRQDWGGSASTGAAVWNGANMAGWYMENKIGRNMINAKVLELGAGVGFGGLVAHSLGAGEVVITDGNMDVLKLADENILINCGADASNIKTARLRWNTDDERNFEGKDWDFIFAADVTYLKKNRHDLFTSIYNLSKQNTVTYLSMEPRSVDEMQDVKSEIESLGMTWQEEKLPVDPSSNNCNLLCPRMLSIRKL